MKTLETMTKDERSLLLFFESCAVDKWGKVNIQHMNKEDNKIAEKWNKEKFIEFGRVASEYLIDLDTKYGSGTHWCKLSNEAWKLAHEERQARGIRVWNKRNWKTTNEQNSRNRF
jgi:hypothetical protein